MADYRTANKYLDWALTELCARDAPLRERLYRAWMPLQAHFVLSDPIVPKSVYEELFVVREKINQAGDRGWIDALSDAEAEAEALRLLNWFRIVAHEVRHAAETVPTE